MGIRGERAPPPGAPLLAFVAAPGAIAQLAERLHGMQEVGGSNPPGSTGKPLVRGAFYERLGMMPLAGLGRRNRSVLA